MVDNTFVDGVQLPDNVATERVVVDGTPVTRVSADGVISYELVAAPNQATSATLDLFNDTDGSVCQGVAINPWIPVNTGGPSTAWTISAGALPPGLAINGTTGVISGTPTTTGAFAWTVRATNGSGFDDFADSISVNTAPNISTSTALGAITNGVAITPWNPTNTGDTGGITWTIAAGTLPTGLAINAGTGQITGTPTVDGVFNFTVRATNECGSSDYANTATVATAVAAPNIVCAGNQTFTNGVAITPFNIVASNSGGAIATYGIAPALPPGLTLNTTTGVVSGTPTVTVGATTYTVTATNAGGSDNCTFDITVNAALAPPDLSTSAAMPDGTVGAAYTYTPTNTGGAVTTWSATGLPTGLSINATTGVVSGTPTTAATFGAIVITATNGAGSDTHNDSVVIAAALAAPNIVCAGNQTFADGAAITAFNVVASNSGGAIATYGIAPALPAGLTLNTTTGVVSGTPTGGASGPTTYTVTATNASGSDNCTFDIEITAGAVGTINTGLFTGFTLATDDSPILTIDLTFNSNGSFVGSWDPNPDGVGGSVNPWNNTIAAGIGANWEIYIEDNWQTDQQQVTVGFEAPLVWHSLAAQVQFRVEQTSTPFFPIATIGPTIHFRPAGSGLNPNDPGTFQMPIPLVRANN